jgi:hypothetical protein
MTFDNNEYWKKRMADKSRSIVGQLNIDFKEIFDNATHIKLNTKPILKQMKACLEEFEKLSVMIDKAREVKK